MHRTNIISLLTLPDSDYPITDTFCPVVVPSRIEIIQTYKGKLNLSQTEKNRLKKECIHQPQQQNDNINSNLLNLIPLESSNDLGIKKINDSNLL